MPDMLLYYTRKPQVYRLSETYDPTEDGPDPSQTGKKIPAVQSIIIDDTLGVNNIQLSVVTFVDDEGDSPTYAFQMTPLVNNIALTDHVVDLGNDMQYLYFEAGYWTPYGRLMIDRKLMFLAGSASYYVLYAQKGEDFAEVAISLLVTDDVVNPAVNEIPLMENETLGVSTLQDCAVSAEYVPPGAKTLSNGEVVTMRLYDASDTLVSQIRLVCVEASALGDLVTPSALVGFDVSEVSDFELTVGSDPQALDITCTLTYDDGSTEQVVPQTDSVDLTFDDPDSACFIYGIDDFIQDIAVDDETGVILEAELGKTYTLVTKYFLAKGVPSPITGENASERFVTHEATLTIVAS